MSLTEYPHLHGSLYQSQYYDPYAANTAYTYSYDGAQLYAEEAAAASYGWAGEQEWAGGSAIVLHEGAGEAGYVTSDEAAAAEAGSLLEEGASYASPPGSPAGSSAFDEQQGSYPQQGRQEYQHYDALGDEELEGEEEGEELPSRQAPSVSYQYHSEGAAAAAWEAEALQAQQYGAAWQEAQAAEHYSDVGVSALEYDSDEQYSLRGDALDSPTGLADDEEAYALRWRDTGRDSAEPASQRLRVAAPPQLPPIRTPSGSHHYGASLASQAQPGDDEYDEYGRPLHYDEYRAGSVASPVEGGDPGYSPGPASVQRHHAPASPGTWAPERADSDSQYDPGSPAATSAGYLRPTALASPGAHAEAAASPASVPPSLPSTPGAPPSPAYEVEGYMRDWLQPQPAGGRSTVAIRLGHDRILHSPGSHGAGEGPDVGDSPSTVDPCHPLAAVRCAVCWDRMVQVVLVPCGHVCMCARCARRVTNCPMCRSAVQHRQRMFLSGCSHT